MVAINFTVFQDKIVAGTKSQTIRQTARCKPGDRLQLYTGMRHKNCRKLGDAVCEAVVPLSIHRDGFIAGDGAPCTDRFGTHGLAKIDGFDSWDDMVAFFEKNYGLPFEGVLIRWKDFTPPRDKPVTP